MVWGCMAARGVGRLHIVEGMVNADTYMNVLQTCMIPSAKQFFQGSFLFQYGNAPCHRAKVVAAWMKPNNMTTIDWPAQSPDLNPIENLWHKIAVEISKRRPVSKKELIESLIAAWNRIVTIDHLTRLVHSMPAR